MILASTSCLNTSSPPVACGNPSASYARHKASHRVPHPRGVDLRRPRRPLPAQPAVQLQLPGRQPLPRGSLQRLQFGIVVRRADPAPVTKVRSDSGDGARLDLMLERQLILLPKLTVWLGTSRHLA